MNDFSGLMRRWSRVVLQLVAIGLGIACLCCGPKPQQARSPLEQLRQHGAGLKHPESLARWLLYELLSPGGEVKYARAARAALDQAGQGGIYSQLARGVDDAAHGKLSAVSDHFLKAAQAARTSDDPNAELIAWFAIRHAIDFRHNASDLYKRWKPFIVSTMEDPKGIGWRARELLVKWWADEAYAEAQKDLASLQAEHFGCLSGLRLAGPFGRGAQQDAITSFPAERPGPWPAFWARHPDRAQRPRVLKTDAYGCVVEADESVGSGAFYVETYFTLDEERSLILAVDNAVAMWVDDVLILSRDPRVWGANAERGAGIVLARGRHRLLARLTQPHTSVRVLANDGRPTKVVGSSDPAPGYILTSPEQAPNPNALSRYLARGQLKDPGDDITRFIVASLAHIEGMGDVANLFAEPLLKDTAAATGVALTASSAFLQTDPIFGDNEREELTRELNERAVLKDPDLWQAQLNLALWEGKRAGAVAAVRPLQTLVKRFPDVPATWTALARIYGQLGWTAEHANTIKRMVESFPNHPEALHVAVGLYDDEGEPDKAEKLVKTIMRLDPDNELRLSRALARLDYDAALREYERLKRRRPERHKEFEARISALRVLMGQQSERLNRLKAAVHNDPTDADARLELADAQYAEGQQDALVQALADAVQNGAPTSNIETALQLIEGMNALEPYRIDGLKVVSEYEKRGKHLAGTAARILDYAAILVHSDGSSRMLEHEIVRVQSEEAISKMAEHPKLNGLVLTMRVIKQDGSILEPEFLHEKPTVTLPHLEPGDYIETEHIVREPGTRGLRYLGPRWFFREESVAYARSEFVVIAPKGKQLLIETRNQVPEPHVSDQDPFVTYHWRVDSSPAAPVEPNSTPITEFLPSVQVAWGIDSERRLRDLAYQVGVLTAVDPRLTRIAKQIVHPLPEGASYSRAQKLYRWVTSNIEEGEEEDGRRTVISKRGNRWRAYLELCRAIGIRTDYLVTKNKLALPPQGPISKALEFTEPVMLTQTERGNVWLTMGDQNTPFGYLPAKLRDVPAVFLTGRRLERAHTPAKAGQDGVSYAGDITLHSDGDADLSLQQTFNGKYAVLLRSSFSQLTQPQLRDVVESRLIGRTFKGARVKTFRFQHFDDPDKPLVLKVTASVLHFARVSRRQLLIAPPFAPTFSRLATLPKRETPLLIGEATEQHVKIRIKLPPGAVPKNLGQPLTLRDSDRRVDVNDRVDGGGLVLERHIELPAGRIQPSAYPRFMDFARRVDNALSSTLRVQLPTDS